MKLDADFILIIVFLTVLAAPIVLYLIDRQQPPTSMKRSIIDIAQAFGVFFLTFTVFHAFVYPKPLYSWNWTSFFAFLFGCLVKISVDWRILRRQSGTQEQ